MLGGLRALIQEKHTFAVTARAQTKKTPLPPTQELNLGPRERKDDSFPPFTASVFSTDKQECLTASPSRKANTHP